MLLGILDCFLIPHTTPYLFNNLLDSWESEISQYYRRVHRWLQLGEVKKSKKCCGEACTRSNTGHGGTISQVRFNTREMGRVRETKKSGKGLSCYSGCHINQCKYEEKKGKGRLYHCRGCSACNLPVPIGPARAQNGRRRWGTTRVQVHWYWQQCEPSKSSNIYATTCSRICIAGRYWNLHANCIHGTARRPCSDPRATSTTAGSTTNAIIFACTSAAFWSTIGTPSSLPAAGNAATTTIATHATTTAATTKTTKWRWFRILHQRCSRSCDLGWCPHRSTAEISTTA